MSCAWQRHLFRPGVPVELTSGVRTVDIEVALAGIVLAVVVGEDKIARAGGAGGQQGYVLTQGWRNRPIPPFVYLTGAQAPPIREGKGQGEGAITCCCVRGKGGHIHTETGVCRLKLRQWQRGGTPALEHEMKRVLSGAEALVRHGQHCLAAGTGQHLGRFAANFQVT